MSSIKSKLEESNPDRVKKFMEDAQKEIKGILGNINNYQVTMQGRTSYPLAYSS